MSRLLRAAAAVLGWWMDRRWTEFANVTHQPMEDEE
jgi:hypothetical protein